MPEMKERFINIPEATKPQETPVIQDLTPSTEKPLPREVADWMKKVETTQATVADDTGTPLLTPAPPVNPPVQLPTTRAKFVAGFKMKVSDAGKWLSTFVLKIVKKNNGNVKFKGE